MSPLLAIVPLLLTTPQMGAMKKAGTEVYESVTRAELPPIGELKTGDMIFHTSTSSQAVAIAAATLSPWTHVGMVRVHKGEAFVIEASATVRVVPLRTFIERGRLNRYTILRDPTLSANERESMWRAVKKLKGKPYDLFFTYDRSRVYCSELIWRAYEAIGKTPSDDELVSDLFINNFAVDALMKARWRRHPTCVKAKAKSLAACLELAKNERIITPAKIAANPRFKVVCASGI